MAEKRQTKPRRSRGYGSLGDRSNPDFPAISEAPHGLEYCYEDENSETPLAFGHVISSPAASPTAAASERGWSWWRVVVIVAVAATALAAAGSVVRLATSEIAAETTTLGSAEGRSSLLTPPRLVGQSPDETAASKTAGPRVAGGTPTASTDDELAFVALNEYTRRGDVVGLGYPWLHGSMLVEPYRSTSLEVVSPQEGMTYRWKVSEAGDTGDEEELGEYEGDVVEVLFHTAPQYEVVLTETSGSGEDAVVTRTAEVELFCRYVRREIRALFDDERNDMFDAMKVLWDVRTEDGVKLYGENYLDVWTIDMFHQVGASDINCDHLHDGIGFGITHSMVTMMFESSMQLVNPKLSLPYWDFTIEGARVDTAFDGDYTRLRDASDLWTAEWFGGVDPVDFQVKDGRWGNVEVPVVPDEYRDMLGADVFGRMRSPWNVNSRPLLTRGLGEMCGIPSTEFYAWPGCESHYNLQDLFTSYYGYTWWSQYGPHGPMHVWVGGNVDCQKTMDTVMGIVGEEYRISLSGYLFVMRKNLFRDHLFKCHGYAGEHVTEEEVMSSGQCGCTDLDFTTGDDYIPIYEIFADKYDFPEFSESEKRVLAAEYCNAEVGMGESSQSSSPLDPTFWSMHPTMERLLVFKLMSGTFTDYSWPDEPGMWTGMDGVEYDVVISTEQDECYGHRGSDVFPYSIIADLITPVFTFNGETGPNVKSNRELIRFFDPSSDALPFIYDNFDWEHCKALGYDFSDFFNTRTGESGPKGTAESDEDRANSGRVHGFGLFKHGESHRDPMHSAPAGVRGRLQ